MKLIITYIIIPIYYSRRHRFIDYQHSLRDIFIHIYHVFYTVIHWVRWLDNNNINNNYSIKLVKSKQNLTEVWEDIYLKGNTDKRYAMKLGLFKMKAGTRDRQKRHDKRVKTMDFCWYNGWAVDESLPWVIMLNRQLV